MNAFTFLQFSDVHLDSSLSSSSLYIPAKKRLERKQEMLNAFQAALNLALERKVDAVLIPGDLWDSENISSQTINYIIECFGQLAEIPVIIAPGNHDYCSTDSPYNQAVLAARGMRSWPANVHIFRNKNFSVYPHPYLRDVSFTGRAFTANVPVSERLLDQSLPYDPDRAINVLLFHGSLDNYKGGDCLALGKRTAPFSCRELAKLPFNYTAVGHYHHYTEIAADNNTIIGAYSGCLCARGIDEVGARYFIIGSITADGQCKLEKIESDKRRIVSLTYNVTDAATITMDETIVGLLAEAGARQRTDIVHLNLTGRYPIGGEPAFIMEKLKESYYHVSILDQTRPDYLIEQVDARTTEGKYVQAMQLLKDEISQSPGEADESSLTEDIVNDALYYGLDALRQKKVVVRYVD